MPVFKLFPILLAMLVVWLLCAILTAADVFPDDSNETGYLARTDIRTNVIHKSPWIRIPYPCQWGIPTVSAGAVFGMLAGVIASMVESVGDYYACARLSNAPRPPPRAINRGIMVEGFGCIIAGLIGSGSGTTSYSENIGAIGITRVGSRRVVQASGVLLIILGCVGKVGAIFITIPDPVVGGMFLAMFGMIAAVGLSNLQNVDLNSSRSLFILASSIFLGLSIPDWVARHPEAFHIDQPVVQQIVTILLTTSMFVGGAIGFFLDLTIPGSDKHKINNKSNGGENHNGLNQKLYSDDRSAYDIPLITSWLKKQKCTRYIPFCIETD